MCVTESHLSLAVWLAENIQLPRPLHDVERAWKGQVILRHSAIVPASESDVKGSKDCIQVSLAHHLQPDCAMLFQT